MLYFKEVMLNFKDYKFILCSGCSYGFGSNMVAMPENYVVNKKVLKLIHRQNRNGPQAGNGSLENHEEGVE